MKKILGVHTNPNGHWVGDGFPVRTLFSYGAQDVSPFLLLDHAGPFRFDPAMKRRGVGQHPHRGFETVTIVYEGEVEHRDSTGRGGIIGPGDVQWMTAASGILHEEFHSQGFTKSGGPFHVAQLWVNLPARDKAAAPGYQSITAAQIPVLELPDKAGSVRVIAGDFAGRAGPARTFTAINVWDMRLNRDVPVKLDLPEGHTAILAVLGGRITINDARDAGASEIVMLAREGREIELKADSDAIVLVLTGEPIDEPIAGYGPFVMNTEEEIQTAIADFNAGRFGVIAASETRP